MEKDLIFPLRKKKKAGNDDGKKDKRMLLQLYLHQIETYKACNKANPQSSGFKEKAVKKRANDVVRLRKERNGTFFPMPHPIYIDSRVIQAAKGRTIHDPQGSTGSGKSPRLP